MAEALAFQEKLLEILHTLLNQTCLLPVLGKQVGVRDPPARPGGRAPSPSPAGALPSLHGAPSPDPGLPSKDGKPGRMPLSLRLAEEAAEGGAGGEGAKPVCREWRILFSVSCSSCDSIQGYIGASFRSSSSLLQEKRR